LAEHPEFKDNLKEALKKFIEEWTKHQYDKIPVIFREAFKRWMEAHPELADKIEEAWRKFIEEWNNRVHPVAFLI